MQDISWRHNYFIFTFHFEWKRLENRKNYENENLENIKTILCENKNSVHIFNPLTTNYPDHIETSQSTGFYMMGNIGC